jgi:hypothetical protein
MIHRSFVGISYPVWKITEYLKKKSNVNYTSETDEQKEDEVFNTNLYNNPPGFIRLNQKDLIDNTFDSI